MVELMKRVFHSSQLAGALALAAVCPGRVCQAQDSLFVSDYNNNVVDQFTSAGTLVNTYSVSQPTGVTVGPDGSLYAATATAGGDLGSAIYTFNTTSGAQTGVFSSHLSDNNQNNPAGMAFGPNGSLYVADETYGGVLVYNHSGTAATPLTSASLLTPTSVAFNSTGTLYIADGANIVSYLNGNYSIINPPAAYANPHDVGVGLNGNLYVLDISGSAGGLYELNPATGMSQELVNYATSLFNPNDLAIGPDGKIFVSGVDGNTGDGEILNYGEDGSSGGAALNLGLNAYPTYMDVVPEPTPFALLSLAGVGAILLGIRRRKSAERGRPAGAD